MPGKPKPNSVGWTDSDAVAHSLFLCADDAVGIWPGGWPASCVLSMYNFRWRRNMADEYNTCLLLVIANYKNSIISTTAIYYVCVSSVVIFNIQLFLILILTVSNYTVVCRTAAHARLLTD